jgi:hypothetical protein
MEDETFTSFLTNFKATKPINQSMRLFTPMKKQHYNCCVVYQNPMHSLWVQCEVLQIRCLTNNVKHWKNMKLCYDVTNFQKKPQRFMGILKGIYLTI